MDPREAAQTLCEYGKKLVREGLVARTWGNFSIRLNHEYCLITPSGRNYEDLTPGEMVKVKVDDGTYQGELKPSSEKELHVRLYLLRPELGAIIHTHQPGASSIAAARKDLPIIKEENRKFLGTMVPCAAYALPTTRSLTKAVIRLCLTSYSPGILLANHGALCMGAHLEEAFMAAKKLEQSAWDFISMRFLTLSKSQKAGPEELIEYYRAHQSRGKSYG
jgi:L-fuculose-phosphate aldolase